MRETDANLLAAAKQERSEGNSDAFEQILLRYEKLILHIARRYLNNPEDALDASQDAIIRIYRGLPNVIIPEDGSLKAWICTVTANTCLDIVRKRRIVADELTDDVISASPTLPSAEESAIANERAREILNAITKLPDDHRMVLILRDMQGLSYEELAEALDLTLGTVKSRLSRARSALKKMLT
ncbi:MAG: RNA polymerase sigma factor [Defluviitaleaceae bacterium]|nr:RNA polymerase sigma factor [Defluviitaleaceae bacterium]